MSESQIIEYKESWRDEYLKWICGFANAQGGTLYIDIDDNGKVCGVADSKKLMEDIPNKIRDTMGIICDVDLEQKDACDVVKVTVEENPYPVNYKGEYHYRSVSTKQELKGAMLSRFLMQKTGLSWDSVPVVNTDIEAFRNDGFDIFREQVRISKHMNMADVNVTNKALAEKLELLSDDGLVTRAGVLTFHHTPEKWGMGSWIKIGYFADDATILYQDEVHGSLMQQVERLMDLLYSKYFTAPITYEGITHVEKFPYSREAVREAVQNAIVHKNYASLTPIQIRVYKDKMRIANDFILPPCISGDRLINEGKSRPGNPKIANTFFRAGFIESWGRGIKEIRSICKDYGTKEPLFEVDQDCVFVTFYPLESELAVEKNYGENIETRAKTENSREKSRVKAENGREKSREKIIQFIKDDGSVTTEQMAINLNLSIKTIEKHIKNLKLDGKIRRVGPDKGGHWEIL